jgi:hypothetical protein
MVVPPAIIAYATQVPFILGLVGITYGILSSSWDEVGVFSVGLATTRIDNVMKPSQHNFFESLHAQISASVISLSSLLN